MDIVGFCTIKKDATTGKGTENPEWFLGKNCTVMEFASDGGVLVLDWESRGMAMFDKEDILRKFECRVMGDYIFPPDLDMVGQIAYMAKVNGRKGGYDGILKNMVIQASLMKGKFHDDFLFQKEREENFQRSTMSEKDRKIMDLEEDLRKHKQSYYGKRNPRKLRRMLRRLRNSQ